MFTLCAAESNAVSYNPFTYIYSLLTYFRTKKETYVFVNPEQTQESTAPFYDIMSNNGHNAYGFTANTMSAQGFFVTDRNVTPIVNQATASQWNSTKHGIAEFVQEASIASPDRLCYKLNADKTMARYMATHLPHNVAAELRSWRAFFWPTPIREHIQKAFIKTKKDTENHLKRVGRLLDDTLDTNNTIMPQLYAAGLIFSYKNQCVCTTHTFASNKISLNVSCTGNKNISRKEQSCLLIPQDSEPALKIAVTLAQQTLDQEPSPFFVFATHLVKKKTTIP
ncbi:MAG: hypothetical protein WC707_02665 [Candidatus Babeliaceae bacterium]|jgi:hypothetical protein